MKKSIITAFGMACALLLGACQDSFDYEAEPRLATATRSAVETLYLPQDATYDLGEAVNGIYTTTPRMAVQGVITARFLVTIPADLEMTGISLRSTGKLLSGRLYWDGTTATAADETAHTVRFMNFVNSSSRRNTQIGEGEQMHVEVALPATSFEAGELTLRIHATGSKSIEAVINEPVTANSTIALTPTVKAQNNWISALSDETYLSQLSIPGTHDAATGDGTTLSIGKTQDLSLQEQWDLGIRVFDLRPGYKRVRKGFFKWGYELHIYHGIIETKTSFKAAIATLTNNLKQNPEEFAIVVMRFESDSPLYNDRSTWNELMASFLTSSDFPAEYRAELKQGMTVGDLRGKLLILARDSYADTPSTGGFVSGWSHSVAGSTNGRIYNQTANIALNIQDYYEVEDSTAKQHSVAAMVDLSTANRDADRWTINHVSGYSGLTNYKQNAEQINPYLYGYIINSPSCTGIVMMDYAGVAQSGSYGMYGKLLPQAIIDSNFRLKGASK